MKELEKVLKEKIKEALNNEVATKVKEVQGQVVEEEVYTIYPEPQRYQRTGKLADPDEMVHEMLDGNTLAVRSDYIDSENNNKNVGYTVATGDGYDYTGFGYAYEQPRPFPEWTADRLNQNKEHVKALKDGLERQGIKVK